MNDEWYLRQEAAEEAFSEAAQRAVRKTNYGFCASGDTPGAIGGECPHCPMSIHGRGNDHRWGRPWRLAKILYAPPTVLGASARNPQP